MDVAAMILIKVLMMAVLQICQIKILRCEINLALIRLQNRIRTRQAHPNSRGTWKTGGVNRQVTIVITIHGHDTAQIHPVIRSEEHTSELQSRGHLVCRLLLEKKKA